ncbi:hypothetical protein P7K49_003333 [Saguinus oedipus]|uniref:Uncharacterized protein n=1 Tax=Saguinus oedipus TaxID=9490 RepID=A0ABQ9WJW7_SAGOE|nr:hypothetical protein P7K49_003333 [Saguinus oedipus]
MWALATCSHCPQGVGPAASGLELGKARRLQEPGYSLHCSYSQAFSGPWLRLPSAWLHSVSTGELHLGPDSELQTRMRTESVLGQAPPDPDRHLLAQPPPASASVTSRKAGNRGSAQDRLRLTQHQCPSGLQDGAPSSYSGRFCLPTVSPLPSAKSRHLLIEIPAPPRSPESLRAGVSATRVGVRPAPRLRGVEWMMETRRKLSTGLGTWLRVTTTERAGAGGHLSLAAQHRPLLRTARKQLGTRALGYIEFQTPRLQMKPTTPRPGYHVLSPTPTSLARGPQCHLLSRPPQGGLRSSQGLGGHVPQARLRLLSSPSCPGFCTPGRSLSSSLKHGGLQTWGRCRVRSLVAQDGHLSDYSRLGAEGNTEHLEWGARVAPISALGSLGSHGLSAPGVPGPELAGEVCLL